MCPDAYTKSSSNSSLVASLAAYSRKNELLLRTAGDGIHIMDSDGILVEMSDSFCRMLGYTRAEMLGMHVSNWDARYSDVEVRQRIAELVRIGEGENRVFETIHRRKDGSLFPVEISANPFNTAKGLFLYNSSRDITERKALESRIERLTKIYRALSEVSQAIAHMEDEMTLFSLVCRMAVDFGGMKMAWIGHHVGESSLFKTDVSYGSGADYLEGIVISASEALPEGRGPAGTAFRENRTMIVNNFGESDITIPWHDEARRFKLGSGGFFPILRGGKPCALLGVYHQNEGAFDAEIIALLEEMTGNISYALDNFEREKERRRVEVLLKESEARLNLALDTMRIGVWDWDMDKDDWHVAPTYYQMLGYKPDVDSRNRGFWREGIHPEDRGFVIAKLETVREEGLKQFDMEYRFRAADGIYHWINNIGRAVEFDKNGKACRMLGVKIDVTDRKQAESLIRIQSDALNASINGVVISDAAGSELHLVYVNPAFEKMTGYSAEELLGRHCPLLQGEGSEQSDLAGLLSCIGEGRAGKATLYFYRKDGSRIWLMVHTSPVLDNDGRITHFLCIVDDITQKKDADDHLNLISSVFLHAGEGIVITDSQGTIIEVNPAFSRMTGYSHADVLGRNPGILHSGRHDQNFYADMWHALLKEGIWEGEIWNRRKNGEIYPESLSISAVRNDQGEVYRYIGLYSDISDLKNQQQQLEMLAHHDALTGLPNRSLLNDRFAMALAQMNRSREKLAVCFMDLDGFKPVNDTFGHETGDLLLIEVARRMASLLRTTDTVARLGGDEFVLIFPEMADEAECRYMLSRIMDSIGRPFMIGGHVIQISASIGVTLYPEDNADADSLLRHADQAMYIAKQTGRNRIHFFDVLHDHMTQARLEGLSRVETALEKGELVLYYHPKVNMRTGKLIGFEALIRWQHPERGLLLPIEFLPLIENSEFEIRLSEWVVTEALKQMAVWRRQGLDLTVSVNIPAHHLQSEGFFDFIAASLAGNPDAPADRLELEILESVALWDIIAVTRTMEACRELGVRFSIDDFGTGYASLAYLRRLPADTIKIDQIFARDMLSNPNDLSIIEGVIGLAEAFQKEVIAEGVETVAHGTMLLHMGCDLAQGFGIAHPMTAEQISDWVRNFNVPSAWHRASIKPRSPMRDTNFVFAEVELRRCVDDWIALTRSASAGMAPVPVKECPFRKWLLGPGKEAFGQLAGFSVIESMQGEVYAMGCELADLCTHQQYSEARAKIPELLHLRDKLIESLYGLIESGVSE